MPDAVLMSGETVEQVVTQGSRTNVSPGAISAIDLRGYHVITEGNDLNYTLCSLKSNHVILSEDGNTRSTVVVRNGVAVTNHHGVKLCHTLASKVVAVNESNDNDDARAYLVADTTHNLAKKLTTSSSFSYLTSMKKALKVVNPRFGWGGGKKNDDTKVVDASAVSYLRSVLINCKQVLISFGKVRSTKEYFKMLSVAAEYPTGLALNYPLIISAAQRLANHNEPDALWYYTGSQKEFNALVLMQGYTKHFSSCQYIELHAVDAEKQRRLVLNKQLIKDTAFGDDYCNDQCDDFGKGVTFYFQLDAEGLVKKRFFTYTIDGVEVSSNHYNVAPLPLTIDGKPEVKPRNGSSARGYGVFQNRPVVSSNFDLCGELTEESFRLMMSTIPRLY